MKKIIFFGYTLDVGGAEKVLVDYINKLNNNKYEIALVLIQKKGEFLSSLPSNVKVIQLRNSNIRYAFFRYLPFIRKKIINKIVEKEGCDIAIGFMEGRSATWVADINKNVRKLAWIHNDVNKFNIGINKREILKSYSKMDKIITVSEIAKDSFSEKYGLFSTKY